MIAVYSNNIYTDSVIEHCLAQHSVKVYHDINQYVQASAVTKLAFVNHINQYCLPANEAERASWAANGTKFAEEIDAVAHHSALTFAFDNEFHSYHCDLLTRFNGQPVHWVVPVVCNQQLAPCVFNAFQFGWTVEPYRRQLAAQLKKLKPFDTKPYWFDALLGWPRPHRDYVHNAVMNDPQVRHKSVYRYMNGLIRDFCTDFLWEPEVQYFAPVEMSANMVRYFDEIMPLSRIVPISIYNQSAYSIVAETSADNRYSFPTEKVIKPMIAQRLFVVFSGVHYLRTLRQLGFQTFDGVIDESYDNIVDDNTRWSAAFEQVKRLCSQDQLVVFDKIRPIVEHNYNVCMNTDWANYTKNKIATVLDL